MTPIERLVQDTLQQAAPALFERIASYNRTPGNYEDWVNWELHHLFSQQGCAVTARPRYRKGRQKACADLRLEYGAEALLLEIKTAHSFTPDSYLFSIQRDYIALLEEKSLPESKALLLFLSSNEADVLRDTVWSNWLGKLAFWPGHAVLWSRLREGTGSDALVYVEVVDRSVRLP